MANTIYTSINPGSTSGNQLATILNDFRNAYVSGNSGTSRPTGLAAGGFWVDTTDSGSPNFKLYFKMYDGTDDILVFTVDTANNKVSMSGSASPFEILKISDDTAGAILKLTKARIADGGQVLGEDVLGEMDFLTKSSSGATPVSASIAAEALEDHTDTNLGTKVTISVIGSGEAALTEALVVRKSGVGIGTDQPAQSLHVLGTGIRSEKLSDDANGARMTMAKARISGDGAVDSADVLGVVESYAKDSSGVLAQVAKLEVTATEDHTSSARGTKLSVQTTKVGANSLTEHIAIGDTVQVKTLLEVDMTKVGQQDVATTATIAQLSADKCVVNFTGATATTVQGIAVTAGKTKVILLHNGSSANVTLAHDSSGATSGERIKLPLGRDITISPDSSIELFYSTAESYWKLKSGSGSGSGGGALVVYGEYGTPETIDAATGITVSEDDRRQLWFIVNDTSGESEVSADPQISAGATIGDELVLVGTNADDTLIFKDGNGLLLNGDWTASDNAVLTLVWTGSEWLEISRR